MEYLYCLGVLAGSFFIVKSAIDKRIDLGGIALVGISLYFLFR